MTHICVSKLTTIGSDNGLSPGRRQAIIKMAAILSRRQCVNTLRPRQYGRHSPDDIFEWIFWKGNVWISINTSLKFVPRGSINNIPTLLQVMAWRPPGDKPLSEPMMVKLTTHICVTRPQCVNKWLCYSGHRVALVVHRAQKYVPVSAGEWPTFLPPPLVGELSWEL